MAGKNTAIVLAAGQGKRMHSKIQKQFLEIQGYPVLYYSLRCFQESPLIQDIILVTGEDALSYCKEEIVKKYGFTKVSNVIAGGKERYDSVYAGLCACKDCRYVLIHDGARPFITEEIYCTLLPEEESIMISDWPVYKEERNFPDAEKAIEGFKEVVRGIRNTRTEMNVPNNRKTSLHIVAKDADTAAMYENSKKSFVNLAFAKEILVQTDKNGISEDAVSVVVSNAVVYMPLEDLIDKDKEIERLTKETERLAKEIARCEGMLNNPNFVNKAPAAKVDAEKDKLAKYKEMMDKVKGQLEQLQK